MDVLDAIMRIVADLFALNDVPAGTSSAIVGSMKSFIQGIMFVFEMLQKLFNWASAA